MPLQHWDCEPKSHYQTVCEGILSEDDYFSHGMHDDANSPSILLYEEHEEFVVCTQDSDSDDAAVSLTQQILSRNVLPSYTCVINETGKETTKEVGEELATVAECIDKIIMPVTRDELCMAYIIIIMCVLFLTLWACPK